MSDFLKKNCVRRALRTFLQTAIGYLAVNVAVVDFSAVQALQIFTIKVRKNNGMQLQNALIGIEIWVLMSRVVQLLHITILVKIFLFSGIIIIIDDYLRYKLFKEEKPKYSFLIKKLKR